MTISSRLASAVSKHAWRIALAITVCASIAITPMASAHVLRSDHGVAAELHIEPYDHPISGRSTMYDLEFDDVPADFTLNSYDITVTILGHSGTVIDRKLLLPANADQISDSYIFPGAADYTLRVQGATHQGDAHPSFTLDYPVHVQAAAQPAATVPAAAWIAGGAAMAVLLLTAVVLERRGRPSTAP